MRAKYNTVYNNDFDSEPSYIRKYLGSEIETVLNPDAGSIHGVDFDSIYVSMPEIEAKFAPLKSKLDSDRCVFLTGVAGCGKSCVLNHVFHIDKKVHIDNNILLIPFSFNHAIAAREKEKIITYMVNILKTACETIENEVIKNGTAQSDNDFFEYIKAIRFDDLQYSDGIKTGTIEQRLDQLLKKDPIDYTALKLKYLLTVFQKINHVVLIVDDIESVGYTMELFPIDIGLTFWSCLKHQPKKEPKVWSSCIVVSCRHYVYRMIQKHSIDEKYTISSGIDSQTLESYPIDDEINISKTVKLSEIALKRTQALIKKKDGRRWNDAWITIEYILVKTDSNLGSFIVAISINNMRKALSLIKKVVLNKRWMQRTWYGTSRTPGAFTINNINQYNLKSPSILRAIGLEEGKIYVSEESVIPNILWNTNDSKSDFITLIVLKSYLNQSNENNNNWRISLDRFDLSNKLKELIRDKEVHQYIDASVEYLIKNRLLLRSKNQAQDDGMDISSDNLSKIRYVYVADGAFALWNQLGRSSVLLELLTDDVFMDYTSEIPERQGFSLFDDVAFDRCLNYLSEMVEKERKYRISAKNDGNSVRLNNLIGADFITEQLLNGLVLSRNAYFKESSIYEDRLQEIQSKINSYKKKLAKK